jgi:hypothetical protein
MGRRQKHVGTPTVSRAVPTDSSAEFHAHFSSQYLGRWQQLFQALAGPVQHVALVNQFAEGHTCEEQGMESLDVPGGLACYRYGCRLMLRSRASTLAAGFQAMVCSKVGDQSWLLQSECMP